MLYFKNRDQEARDDAQKTSGSHAVLTQVFHSSDQIVEKLQNLFLVALLRDFSIILPVL